MLQEWQFACIKCFLLNPHLDLELDYIVRKPMKCMEILSTFHTGAEYISQRTVRHSAHSNKWGRKCRIIEAKTTSGFNSDHTIRQYAHGLLLESLFYRFVPIAGLYGQKLGKNGRLGGHRGETGSRNGSDPKINFLTLVFYSLLQTGLS